MPNATAGVQSFTVPWGDCVQSRPLESTATTYYPMEAVGINAAGNAVKCDDTVGLTFDGFIYDLVQIPVPTGASAGDFNPKVGRPWLFSATIAAAVAADIGRKVYWQFSGTVAYSGLNFWNYAGRVFAQLSTTTVLVAPPWSPYYQYATAHDSHFITAATGTITLTKMQLNKLVELTSTAAQTLNLPAVALTSPGDQITFVNTVAGGFNVTLTGNAAETINGSNTQLLPSGQWAVVTVESDGTQWIVKDMQANMLAGVMVVSMFYDANSVTRSFAIPGRAVRVLGVTGKVDVAGTGGACTAVIRHGATTVAPGSGTLIHTGTYNLVGTVNANQALTLAAQANLEIPAGDAICYHLTGTPTSAVGVISVLLGLN